MRPVKRVEIVVEALVLPRVTEIVDAAGIRGYTVLRNAGLVTSRRDGLWIYYSRSGPENARLRTFTADLVRLLEADADLTGSLVTDPRYAELPPDEVARMAKK